MGKRIYRTKETAFEAMERASKARRFNTDWALEHLTEELRNDEEIMLAVLDLELENFRHTGAELKRDKDFLIKALKQARSYGDYIFERIDSDIASDRAFVLKAVETNKYVYLCLSDELKQDAEIKSTAERI